MSRASTLVALALLGCSGPVTVSISLDHTRYVPGWAEDAALEARTIAVAKTAIEVWGRDEHALDGWDILLTNSHTAHVGEAFYDWDEGGTIVLDVTYTDLPCIEATPLAHEVGHLAISGHDPNHLDPRWRDPVFSSQMAAALVALVPVTDTICIDYLTKNPRSWTGTGELGARPQVTGTARRAGSPVQRSQR